jgi:HSP20 family protein
MPDIAKEVIKMSEPRDFEGEMSRLRDRMNRVFNGLSREAEQPEPLSQVGWEPSLDVLEDKDNITVKVDIPGLKPDEIDLSISGDILRIKGERKQEIEREDQNYHTIERGYGKFDRRVVLPTLTETDSIVASYKGGVLTVRLPKVEEKAAGEIKVDLE